MDKLTIKSLLQNLQADIFNIQNVTFVKLQKDKITGVKRDKKVIYEFAYINAHDIDVLLQRYIDDLGDEIITTK